MRKSLSLIIRRGKGLEDALLEAKVTEEVEKDIVIYVWKMIVKQDIEVYKQAISGESIDLKELLITLSIIEKA